MQFAQVRLVILKPILAEFSRRLLSITKIYNVCSHSNFSDCYLRCQKNFKIKFGAIIDQCAQ